MALLTNEWKVDTAILISALFVFAYYKIKKVYRYFEERNIKYVRPVFLLGSDPDGVLLRIHPGMF